MYKNQHDSAPTESARASKMVGNPPLTVFDLAPAVDLALHFDVRGLGGLVDREETLDDAERDQVRLARKDGALESYVRSQIQRGACFSKVEESGSAPASLKASKSDTTEPSLRTVASGCRVLRMLSYSSILTS